MAYIRSANTWPNSLLEEMAKRSTRIGEVFRTFSTVMLCPMDQWTRWTRVSDGPRT